MKASLLVRFAQTLLVKDYSDELVLRLKQVNTGMSGKGRAAAIKRATELMPREGVALEIGAFTGFATNLITYFMDMHGRKIRYSPVIPGR